MSRETIQIYTLSAGLIFNFGLSIYYLFKDGETNGDELKATGLMLLYLVSASACAMALGTFS